MAMTDQGARVELESQERSEATPRRRRTRTYVAVGVTAVLVLGGGGAYARWDSAQEQLLTTVQAENTDAVAAYSAALDELMAALDHEVSRDVILRDDRALSVLVSEDRTVERDDDATTNGAQQTRLIVDRGPAAIDPTVLQRLPRAQRITALEHNTEWVSTDTEHLRALTAEAVAAQSAWELEQARAGYMQASADLAAAIDAASAVLSASEGQVLDEATRAALAAAIDAATALRDQPPADDAGVDALTAATAAASEATSTLPTVAQAVVDQQAAWQAEQDRIAGEQAARAAAEQAAKARSAAAQQPRSSTSKGSSSQQSTSGSKSGSSSGSGTRSSSSGAVPAPAPKAEPEPEYERYCLGGDEYGNTWSC